MSEFTWDHLQLRSPDPEATAEWFERCLDARIIRHSGKVDIRLAGINIFIAPVTDGDGVAPPPLPPYQGLDHFGLTVDNLDEVASTLKSRGVVFTQEPVTIRPGVRGCFIRGPQNISIEILERRLS
ncbi:VOC family protein [Yokenella regensburgei]|uniref:VOC family protein n=1 Tax=Yokenella regensburgei TaxID=158877 RepID=UPI003F179D07